MRSFSIALVTAGLAGIAGCALDPAEAPSGAGAAGAGAPREGDCRAARLTEYKHQPVCLKDAELDSIVAGKVTIVETGLNTWIVNPGKASVGILHKDGSFTCINLCGVPPPPGGGGN